ncbi:MAG: hypothetical protein JWP01_1408 [Myxococcales bacterium]|nr:hypothetical protein [Myxococcales bacterium]
MTAGQISVGCREALPCRMSDRIETRTSQVVFVRGAAVSPVDVLIAWLDAQTLNGEPRLLRLPIVLHLGDAGFLLRGARIGREPDALAIYVNDASLGIGVADRARTLCPTATTCALWLEGYWRREHDGAYRFDVSKIHEQIAGHADASHVEVEGESGN